MINKRDELKSRVAILETSNADLEEENRKKFQTQSLSQAREAITLHRVEEAFEKMTEAIETGLLTSYHLWVEFHGCEKCTKPCDFTDRSDRAEAENKFWHYQTKELAALVFHISDTLEDAEIKSNLERIRDQGYKVNIYTGGHDAHFGRKSCAHIKITL